MQISNSNSQYTYNFTSRCKQIRDAQDICHAINTTFPRFSTTQHIPTYKKLIVENGNFTRGTTIPESMKDILKLIRFYTQTPLKPYQLHSEPVKQNHRLLKFAEDIIQKMGKARNVSDYKQGEKTIESTLYQLENYRLGNCYEDAKITELILLLNGVKNSCLAKLKTPFKNIDHIVCIFNQDGSAYTGEIGNGTIVIDNWAGKADYAKNMSTHYKNLFKNHFYISPNDPIEYAMYEKHSLTPEQIEKFKEKYPQFVFKDLSLKKDN